jgi:signal transduction histidine kinase
MDTGVGIPAAYIDRIFDSFFQTRESACEGHGTGLGLALVKRLVEAHGGRIRVHSEPGAGTKFNFSLPDEKPAEKKEAQVGKRHAA